MKRQATHRGECQICGRAQMLPDGVLSKHGYTVDWGFFNGVCPGAGHRPFEKYFDLLAGAISRAEEWRDGLGSRIEDLQTNTDPETSFGRYYVPYQKAGNGKGGYRYAIVPAASVHESDGRSPVRGNGNWVATVIDNGHEFEAFIAARVDGKTQAQAVLEGNQSRAKKIAADLAQTEAYIEWQTKRIEDWAPRPLTPIKGR